MQVFCARGLPRNPLGLISGNFGINAPCDLSTGEREGLTNTMEVVSQF